MSLLEHGSEPELRAEIERQIRAGRRNGSRFVMSIGSPVTPGTSIERVRTYCSMARDLGRA
jgi:uroporphyrinogen-III decarboxylase